MKSFDEAVLAVQARPNSAYIGFLLWPDEKKAGWYQISTDPENAQDLESVSIQYEGGMLFSSCGEDDFYSLDDVPVEARSLRFIDSSTLPKMCGYTTDYVLARLFPELPDPETVWGTARDEFLVAAVEIARDTGRATVL
jgi:hypothetical protein